MDGSDDDYTLPEKFNNTQSNPKYQFPMTIWLLPHGLDLCEEGDFYLKYPLQIDFPACAEYFGTKLIFN